MGVLKYDIPMNKLCEQFLGLLNTVMSTTFTTHLTISRYFGCRLDAVTIIPVRVTPDFRLCRLPYTRTIFDPTHEHIHSYHKIIPIWPPHPAMESATSLSQVSMKSQRRLMVLGKASWISAEDETPFLQRRNARAFQR
jgi:hypothetical protein